MKPNLFKTAGICATALIIGMNCYAEKMPDVEYKYNESKVVVSGEASEGDKFISLQILKAGKGFDASYKDADVMFCDQVEPDENGKYTFEIDYKYTAQEYDLKTDEYAMRLTSNTSVKTTTDIDLVKFDDFESAYNELNDAADKDSFGSFKDTVNNKRAELNFGFGLTDDVKTLDAELKDYYEYAKAKAKQGGLVTADESDNTAIFRTYMTAYYLNRNSIENVDTVIDSLYFKNAELLTDYNKVAESNAIQKYLTAKMSQKGINNLDEFEDALIEAVILTQTRYADGSDDVKNILAKYGSKIGINSTADESVYRKLAGSDFEDGDKFAEKYEELRNNPGTSGGSGGGGGGGGGSSSGGGKDSSFNDSYKFENTEKEEAEKASTIKMTFEDLDGVMWASEAILALADKGIVNGKGNNMFAPDDNVTREEFAKILVGAMGLDKGQAVTNGFADVNANEWYSRSVNIAKNAGIVNGIGDGKFGTGMSITREDMVVMIYNALRSKGVNMVVSDVTFSDASMISDYALNAVGALYKMGAVNGVSETEFSPKGIASRAQAAKIIYNVIELLQ